MGRRWRGTRNESTAEEGRLLRWRGGEFRVGKGWWTSGRGAGFPRALWWLEEKENLAARSDEGLFGAEGDVDSPPLQRVRRWGDRVGRGRGWRAVRFQRGCTALPRQEDRARGGPNVPLGARGGGANRVMGCRLVGRSRGQLEALRCAVPRRAMLWALAVCACPLLFLPGSSWAGALHDGGVAVTATLNTTWTEGATSPPGSASGRLRVGETKRMAVAAGRFERDGQCGGGTASGPPDGGADSMARDRLSEALGDGPGHFWEVAVRLEAWEEARASLVVEWEREDRDGTGRSRFERRAELSLAAGERRILDFVPFEAPRDERTCAVAAYHVELTVAPVPVASMAHKELAVELWFAPSGGEGEHTTATTLVQQAEERSFRLPPLASLVPGVETTEGEGLELLTRCVGTLRAWSTAEDEVAIQMSPAVSNAFGPPLAGTSLSSGSGSKLYRARLGEVVELAIPASWGTIAVPAEGLQASAGQAVDGVAFADGALRVALAPLLGTEGYSLRVRVRAAD